MLKGLGIYSICTEKEREDHFREVNKKIANEKNDKNIAYRVLCKYDKTRNMLRKHKDDTSKWYCDYVLFKNCTSLKPRKKYLALINENGYVLSISEVDTKK